MPDSLIVAPPTQQPGSLIVPPPVRTPEQFGVTPPVPGYRPPQQPYDAVPPDDLWFQRTFNRPYPQIISEYDQWFREQTGDYPPIPTGRNADPAAVPSLRWTREQLDPEGNAARAQIEGEQRTTLQELAGATPPPNLVPEQPPDERSSWERFSDLVRNVRISMDPAYETLVHGASFGFSDELAGLVGGPEARAEAQANLRKFHELAPGWAIATELLGGLGFVAGTGLSLLRGASPTVASITGRSAAEGALYAGAYGMGTGEGSLTDRALGAVPHFAAGGVLGGIVGRLGAGISRGAQAAAAPTRTQLDDMASALYQAAHDAGLRISATSFRNVAQQIATVARDAGIDRDIHTAAAAFIRRLSDELATGRSYTLQDIDRLRQVLGGVIGSSNKSERRIGYIMRNALDNFMENLTPADVISGNPQVAVDLIGDARAFYRTARKTEMIEQAFTRARNAVGANYTQAGMQTALRQQLNQFSPEEQRAILKVVRGGRTENVLRAFGRLAPRGAITGAIPIGIGFASNPFVAGSFVVGAELGRYLATRMSLRNVDAVSTLVRSGSPAGAGGKTANIPLQRLQSTTFLEGFVTSASRLGGMGFTEATAEPQPAN